MLMVRAQRSEPRSVSIFLAGRKRQSLLASPIDGDVLQRSSKPASGIEAEWPRLRHTGLAHESPPGCAQNTLLAVIGSVFLTRFSQIESVVVECVKKVG